VTRLGAVSTGVRFPAGVEKGYFLRHRVQTGSGGNLASYPIGAGGSSPGVKRPEREADHSPPSISEVNAWSHISTHGVVLN